MKLISFLTFIFVALGLMACQPRSQTNSAPGGGTVGSPVPAGGGSVPLPSGGGGSQVGGIDAVGGGNGVDGMMIEDFRVYVNGVDSFKRLEQKVFKKLITRFPKLAADIYFIAHQKAWYFIPTQLNTLPSSRIGVSFKTDQYGLHTPHEIYIDLRFYRDMTESVQETLILHEIVMGIRLLEFANPLERCLVDIEVMKFDLLQEQAYNDKRESCFRKHKAAASIGSELSLDKAYHLEDSDYPFIRDLTATLINHVDTFNPTELEVWMAVNHFRTYSEPPSATMLKTSESKEAGALDGNGIGQTSMP